MSTKSILKGLDEAVQISEAKLESRSNILSITPLHDYNNYEIKNIRTKLNVTQVAFAALLGVSKKTVEAWEKGTNSPNGPARRILELLCADNDLMTKYHILNR
jgi:putative transcriptional regulator